ncbi:MAG TPA: UDP-N-acetylmuramate--L-alanine ligase [Tissierellaceae bacterium]|nr:UDP-N-acetylmuramate--L-alanine ligase [Tissierellaceae bacterium]
MFEFSIGSNKYSKIHFVGIGGISMSGLAEILVSEGYKVTGSDSNNSLIIKRLKNLGIPIYLGHNAKNINGVDLIIYTDAIPNDNPELNQGVKDNIPLVDRATFLGALMKNYKNSIAVSGTHGKTTTTSMLSTILNPSSLNPTILLGGQLDEIGGNIKLGSKDFILTEACEYKGNILKYFPTMAIVLNIDEDHLDYFKSMDHIINTFVDYGRNLSKDDYLVINSDDPGAERVIKNTKAKIITFGFNKDSDYRVENVDFAENGFSSYLLNIKNHGIYNIKLNVMGTHNIYNSVASIVAAHIHGITMEDIQKNITRYKGVNRRLEYKGSYNGVKIIDDYAHHPTEIKATLDALKNSTASNIYCVFQPHTYTRTKFLLNSFAESFKGAYKTIITDIYAAREKDNGIVHSRDLKNAITNKGLDAIYLKTFKEIETYLKNNTKENDIIVTMGAGNIYLVGESILEKDKEKAAV